MRSRKKSEGPSTQGSNESGTRCRSVDLDQLRVLLIDDEEPFCRGFTGVMRRLEPGWIIESTTDPRAGTADALARKYDVILVDWGLDDQLTGLDVCTRLRSNGLSAAIIMLTAWRSVDDRVLAVEAGADDYIVKGQMSRVGEAERIRTAVALRATGLPRRDLSGTVAFGPLSLDIHRCHLHVDGRSRGTLSPRSFRLLLHLLTHHSRFVSWNELGDDVFDANLSQEAKHTSVHRLRRTLGSASSLLVTKRGGCGLFLSGSRAKR